MSGDLIWVRQKNGRLGRERDKPDLCGNGHPETFYQESWCRRCRRETGVFRCYTAGCTWAVAVPRHYESGGCDPGKATDTERARAR